MYQQSNHVSTAASKQKADFVSYVLSYLGFGHIPQSGLLVVVGRLLMEAAFFFRTRMVWKKTGLCHF